MRKLNNKAITVIVGICLAVVVIASILVQSAGQRQKSDIKPNRSSVTSSESSQSNNNTSSTTSTEAAKDSQTSSIGGLNGQTANLPDEEIGAIVQQLNYTLTNNGITTSVKDAKVRDGTFNQTLTDSNRMIYHTTFMVDIPSLKRSFYVEDDYSPLPVEKSGLTDYTRLVLCPTVEQRIYDSNTSCSDRITNERTEQ